VRDPREPLGPATASARARAPLAWPCRHVDLPTCHVGGVLRGDDRLVEPEVPCGGQPRGARPCRVRGGRTRPGCRLVGLRVPLGPFPVRRGARAEDGRRVVGGVEGDVPFPWRTALVLAAWFATAWALHRFRKAFAARFLERALPVPTVDVALRDVADRIPHSAFGDLGCERFPNRVAPGWRLGLRLRWLTLLVAWPAALGLAASLPSDGDIPLWVDTHASWLRAGGALGRGRAAGRGPGVPLGRGRCPVRDRGGVVRHLSLRPALPLRLVRRLPGPAVLLGRVRHRGSRLCRWIRRFRERHSRSSVRPDRLAHVRGPPSRAPRSPRPRSRGAGPRVADRRQHVALQGLGRS
jgi:hypothetical protein